jgi:hypothetical protein
MVERTEGRNVVVKSWCRTIPRATGRGEVGEVGEVGELKKR